MQNFTALAKITTLSSIVLMPLFAHAQAAPPTTSLVPSPTLALPQLALAEALGLTTKTTDFAYRLTIDGDEAEVSVYQALTNATYEIHAFHCHSEMNAAGKIEGAHCHDEGTLTPVPHTLPAKLIDRSGLLSAINSALNIFESRIAKIETILELKIWQHDDEMTLKIASGDLALPDLNYFMCHMHGANYDCHRTRKPGPSEPAN